MENEMNDSNWTVESNLELDCISEEMMDFLKADETFLEVIGDSEIGILVPVYDYNEIELDELGFTLVKDYGRDQVYKGIIEGKECIGVDYDDLPYILTKK